MKFVCTLFGLFLASLITAQPKLISRAIITTTTTVTAPDDEDVSQIQGQGGGSFNFRNMMDGETKSTTFVKNQLTKTTIKSESMKGSVYRDNDAKTTTTIYEVMGNVQGVVASDDDQVQMKKQMDSIVAARAKTDTTIKQRPRTVDFVSTVAYLEDTKKIAGYTCKKAIIITDKIIKKDSQTVWYTPELKFATLTSTGGLSAIPMMRMVGGGGGADNFEKVNGFVMMYERSMPRGRMMEVKVTKIELDKEVADKEFEIPKDVDIKTMKEMQNMGGIRMMSR